MPGYFSDSEVGSLLAYFAASACWVGLGYEQPTGTRSDLVEITGPTYARLRAEWRAAVRSIYNVNSLIWSNLPSSSVVTYVLGFTQQTGGSNRFYVPLIDPSQFAVSGASFEIQPGKLIVGIDVVIT